MGDCLLFLGSITFVIYLMIDYQFTVMRICIHITRKHPIRSRPVEAFIVAESDEAFHPVINFTINVVGEITTIIMVLIVTKMELSIPILIKIYPLLEMLLKLNNEVSQVVNV
jgi:hypothetical protein